MKFELRQQAKAALGQHLKVAPRVIQAMEILQLPQTSLEERVEQELQSNVALEVAEEVPDEDDRRGAADERAAEQEEDSEVERTLVVGERGEDFERLRRIEEGIGEEWHGDSLRDTHRAESVADARAELFANAPGRGASLEESLADQWALAEQPAGMQAIGRQLIPFIGSNGLWTMDAASLARELAAQGIATDEATVNRVIDAMQRHFEPPGIAARDMRECLLLQLDSLEERARGAASGDEPVPEAESRFADARTLVSDHLDDLRENRIPRIEQRTGMVHTRVVRAMELLRLLDIAPGRALAQQESLAVRADVIIEREPEGDSYVARLADGTVPNLKVSEAYQRMSRERGTDDATRTLLSESIRRAQWFIDAVEQRGATLLRVVNVIVRVQHDALEQGFAALRPMPMTDVASELGMNVSTVSRAVSGKWASTPRGPVELRRFFSGGRETESGADLSWDAVKAIVKEIVDAEDRRAPLSDSAIAAQLKARGITLARRTVVKYREQMGIPAARMRRRHGD
jgi:RNA polymerase sigma-54 factor